jgi:hypothetical protein
MGLRLAASIAAFSASSAPLVAAAAADAVGAGVADPCAPQPTTDAELISARTTAACNN